MCRASFQMAQLGVRDDLAKKFSIVMPKFNCQTKKASKWPLPSSSSSRIAASDGLALVTTRLLRSGALEGFLETVRGPVPPISLGRPRPSFDCTSFAFLVREAGPGMEEVGGTEPFGIGGSSLSSISTSSGMS